MTVDELLNKFIELIYENGEHLDQIRLVKIAKFVRDNVMNERGEKISTKQAFHYAFLIKKAYEMGIADGRVDAVIDHVQYAQKFERI